ncbi:MAG: DUF1365 domain-containing protein [Sulfurimonadaceae bacterium]|nr:DUF1365 domain-containing protein [Sulfurimonadaceae bacterium]
MSHRFLEGSISHKRFAPKEHAFSYPFYMVDIDLSSMDELEKTLFAFNGFNLFSFRSKDHFGHSDDFYRNVRGLLNSFGIRPTGKMRFITLPRIMNFVFNPISVLLLFEKNQPKHMLAEVHNYNGGRVVYHVALEPAGNGTYKGEAAKDMYVSPFFDRQGTYRFTLNYDVNKASFNIVLNEGETKMLNANFSGKALPFNTGSCLRLFFRHSLLTLWVVTRTLWQTVKLWNKGLQWHSPQQADQIRRY